MISLFSISKPLTFLIYIYVNYITFLETQREPSSLIIAEEHQKPTTEGVVVEKPNMYKAS
jgi:hypothetical protein